MTDPFVPDNEPRHYILDEEHRVVHVGLLRWAEWFEGADRHVAETFTELYRVSTIFLGLDHQWGQGPAMLFETMVFEKEGHPSRALPGMIVHDDMEGELWRYATWDDAVAGHAATVKRVLKLEADAMAKARRQPVRPSEPN